MGSGVDALGRHSHIRLGRYRRYREADVTRWLEECSRPGRPIAVMATAGHRSMTTMKGYLHLAGVVFRDEASALERRLLGVQDAGTKSPEPAQLSEIS